MNGAIPASGSMKSEHAVPHADGGEDDGGAGPDPDKGRCAFAAKVSIPNTASAAKATHAIRLPFLAMHARRISIPKRYHEAYKDFPKKGYYCTPNTERAFSQIRAFISSGGKPFSSASFATI